MKRRDFLKTSAVVAASPTILKDIFYGNTKARDIAKADAADLGFEKIHVFKNTFNGHYPSWSRNGRSIIFDQRRQLMAINAYGSELRRIALPTKYGYLHCSVSPDGNRVVYRDVNSVKTKRARSRKIRDNIEERFHIHTLDLREFSKKQITNDLFDNENPSWSPDGKTIVFSRGYVARGYSSTFLPPYKRSDESIPFNIWTINLDETGERRITNSKDFEYNPSWSPCGKKIALDNLYDIFVIDVDGEGRKRLTFDETEDSYDRINNQPSFSTDGSKIIFSKNRLRLGSDLWVMNSDGSNQTRLTNDDNIYGSPVWSPRGDEIAFFNDGYVSVMKLKTKNRYL